MAEAYTLEELPKYIEALNTEAIKYLMTKHGLVVEDGKLKFKDKQTSDWVIEGLDKGQLNRKILLNSLYGAILNPYSRFYDQRVGQSVTLTGRCVSRHMNSAVNEIINGEYDYNGEAIIYGDTDSSYFSMWPEIQKTSELRAKEWSRQDFIDIYNSIGDAVNETFAGFLYRTFNVPEERCVVAAERESVASKGLFITKKRYAIMSYDVGNKRFDTIDPKTNIQKPGKLKAMGLDLKRSDTPIFMQKFLEEILMMVLTDELKKDIFERIITFREEFRRLQPWQQGTPKKVNALSKFGNLRKLGKTNMPGHVRASLNWNEMIQNYGDNRTANIMDGAKIIVCKLKANNLLGYTSIAYPIDEFNLPTWFKELPFDSKAMESAILDKKLQNLLGVLGWDLEETKNDSTFGDLFSFE